MKEYTIEVYKENGTWYKQIDVFDTYEKAEKYTNKNPLNEGLYYSIWCIEYNTNGEEINSYPVY